VCERGVQSSKRNCISHAKKVKATSGKAGRKKCKKKEGEKGVEMEFGSGGKEAENGIRSLRDPMKGRPARGEKEEKIGEKSDGPVFRVRLDGILGEWVHLWARAGQK